MTIFGRKVTHGRTVRQLPKQTGITPDLERDKSRKALTPGKRISKTGNVYWETRKNRSDKMGKRL